MTRHTLWVYVFVMVLIFFLYDVCNQCRHTYESFADATTATVQYREVRYNGKAALLVLDPSSSIIKEEPDLPELVLKGMTALTTPTDQTLDTTNTDQQSNMSIVNKTPSQPMKNKQKVADPEDIEDVSLVSVPPTKQLSKQERVRNVGTNSDNDGYLIPERITNDDITKALISSKQYRMDSCSSVKDFLDDPTKQFNPVVLQDLIPDYKDKIIDDDVQTVINTLNTNMLNHVKSCKVKFNKIKNNYDSFRSLNKLDMDMYDAKPNGTGCDSYANLSFDVSKKKASAPKLLGTDFDEFRQSIDILEKETMDLIDKKHKACLIKLTIIPQRNTYTFTNKKRTHISVTDTGIDISRQSHKWGLIDVFEGSVKKGVQLKSKNKNKQFAMDKCLTLSSDDTFSMDNCDENNSSQHFQIQKFDKKMTLCHATRNTNNMPHCVQNDENNNFTPIDSLSNPGEKFLWKM
jgi:hypothetical protein